LYYDATFQTIDNRLGNDKYPDVTELEQLASKKNAEIIKALEKNLPDSRMQNIVLLRELANAKWIEGFTIDLIDEILQEILPSRVYEKNEKILKEN
jgi:hypothetical protein